MALRTERGYAPLLAQPFARLASRGNLPPECDRSRIPVRVAHELLRDAVRLNGDPYLGLKAGRQLTRGDGGALDYAMDSAATVEDAMRTACRFIRLLNGDLQASLQLREDEGFLCLESSGPSLPAAEDFLMAAFFVVHVRPLLSQEGEVEVWLTQRAPKDDSEHAMTFQGARVQFTSPRRGFRFSRAFLQSPLPRADAKLHRILLNQLERDMVELPETETFTERVRNLMLNETPLVTCTLPQVASKLHMTVRTLSRRLHDEGTGFGELVDTVRQARALEYLHEGEMSVEKISRTLGFSSGSAFHRAFKRWTGTTPSSQHRGRNRPPVSGGRRARGGSGGPRPG